MNDRIICNGAIQIPILGPTFNKVNICCMQYTKQVILNLQKNDEPSHDEPYFLSYSDAINLVSELNNSIWEIENGGQL